MDTLADQATAIKKLDFDRFIQMKSNFLQNINLEWLIQGHLTKNEALGLVSQTEQSMPQFSRIEILPQQKLQIVKLRPTYYYEFRAENPKTSKNSGCMVVF